MIGGRRYLLIPADDGVEVNGVSVSIPNEEHNRSQSRSTGHHRCRGSAPMYTISLHDRRACLGKALALELTAALAVDSQAIERTVSLAVVLEYPAHVVQHFARPNRQE